jgi:hypothetical protein
MLKMGVHYERVRQIEMKVLWQLKKAADRRPLVDMREVHRQEAVIRKIKRRINAGRKDWIPALEVALRELERVKGRG